MALQREAFFFSTHLDKPVDHDAPVIRDDVFLVALQVAPGSGPQGLFTLQVKQNVLLVGAALLRGRAQADRRSVSQGSVAKQHISSSQDHQKRMSSRASCFQEIAVHTS